MRKTETITQASERTGLSKNVLRLAYLAEPQKIEGFRNGCSPTSPIFLYVDSVNAFFTRCQGPVVSVREMAECKRQAEGA